MKRKQAWKWVVLTAAVLVSVAACGKKKEVESTAPSTETMTESGQENLTSSAETTADASEQASEKAETKSGEGKSRAGEKLLTGKVIDAAMNSLVLEGDDGKSYELSKSPDADISLLPDGVEINSRVTVTIGADGSVTKIVPAK